MNALEILNSSLTNIWFKRKVGNRNIYWYYYIIDISETKANVLIYRPDKTYSNYEKTILSPKYFIEKMKSFNTTDDEDLEIVRQLKIGYTKFILKH